MRVESQKHRIILTFFAFLSDRFENLLVTPVNAVESTHRHDHRAVILLVVILDPPDKRRTQFNTRI